MPRGTRLDIEGALHHVMVRGDEFLAGYPVSFNHIISWYYA